MESDAQRKSLFYQRGWCRFPRDPALLDWIEAALPSAREAVVSEEHRQWLRYGGTWFAGVNALPNNPQGAVGSSGPLRGQAVDFIRDVLGITDFHWDSGQLSICYPGYPKPMEGESEGAFRFRLRRDAAHVDGLIPDRPSRRRYLEEHHGFILGIPMVPFNDQASPFVIWEGSHELIRTAFRELYAGQPEDSWVAIDVSEIYQRVRASIFECCNRVTIHCQPGEAFLVHRLALHGTAPWGEMGDAGDDGRMICYFRPEYRGPGAWLSDP